MRLRDLGHLRTAAALESEAEHCDQDSQGKHGGLRNRVKGSGSRFETLSAGGVRSEQNAITEWHVREVETLLTDAPAMLLNAK